MPEADPFLCIIIVLAIWQLPQLRDDHALPGAEQQVVMPFYTAQWAINRCQSFPYLPSSKWLFVFSRTRVEQIIHGQMSRAEIKRAIQPTDKDFGA